MRLVVLFTLFTSALLATPTGARNVDAARDRLRPFQGTFRVSGSAVGDTTMVWRMRPVIGGKYLELEDVLKVAFRMTVGFDSTSSRYRMSLLDAGSGAFDVYEGDFDADGALVLPNPHFWRTKFTPTPTGWRYGFEHSRDGGATWEVGPGVVMTRLAEQPWVEGTAHGASRGHRRPHLRGKCCSLEGDYLPPIPTPCALSVPTAGRDASHTTARAAARRPWWMLASRRPRSLHAERPE